jgi:hypothetical protein
MSRLAALKDSLGCAGGYFKMGRYLQLPTTSPTQVLVSIANALGVNPTSFGKDAYAATTGLSALNGQQAVTVSRCLSASSRRQRRIVTVEANFWAFCPGDCAERAERS